MFNKSNIKLKKISELTLEEFWRTQTIDTPYGAVPFEPWHQQGVFAGLVEDNRYSFVLQARQTGFSTIADMICFHAALQKPGQRILILNAFPRRNDSLFSSLEHNLFKEFGEHVLNVSTKKQLCFFNGSQIDIKSMSCSLEIALCSCSYDLIMLADFGFNSNFSKEQIPVLKSALSGRKGKLVGYTAVNPTIEFSALWKFLEESEDFATLRVPVRLCDNYTAIKLRETYNAMGKSAQYELDCVTL